MDRELRKGLLDICILKCLTHGSSYGYKIISDLSKYIVISESTLYPILKRLEISGSLETYTEEHNGRLRKYYKITDKGINRIDEFKQEWKEIDKIYKFITKGEKKSEQARVLKNAK